MYTCICETRKYSFIGDVSSMSSGENPSARHTGLFLGSAHHQSHLGSARNTDSFLGSARVIYCIMLVKQPRPSCFSLFAIAACPCGTLAFPEAPSGATTWHCSVTLHAWRVLRSLQLSLRRLTSFAYRRLLVSVMPHARGIHLSKQHIATDNARVHGNFTGQCCTRFTYRRLLVSVVPHARGILLTRQFKATDSARVHGNFRGQCCTRLAYCWLLVSVVPHALGILFRRQLMAADSARVHGNFTGQCFTSEAERASVSCFSWAVPNYRERERDNH